MQNIIFLDIDGPLIPTISYLFDQHASINQNLNEQCVEILRKILEKSFAKLVLNTTHNTMLNRFVKEERLIWPGLLNQLKEVDLYKYLYQSSFHTKYPDMNRLNAIHTWLQENNQMDANWVALDDEFIDHPNAYQIDYDVGIGFGAYNFCAEKFNYKGLFVL